MKRKVGIISIRQTDFIGKQVDKHLSEMAYSVIKPCLDETGLKFANDGTGIDHQVIVTNDHWDGQTLSDVKYHDIMGGNFRDLTRVTQDGAEAIMYAVAAIQSGHVDVVMVMGVNKETMIKSRNALLNFSFEPIFDRALGFDYRIAAALQAEAYMDKYNITREHAAKIVEKNTKNASLNRHFPNTKGISAEDVLKSPMIADPLSQLDEYPVSEGAVCMILATEEKAKKLCDNPVWITGYGTCKDTYDLGSRDLSGAASLEIAANTAYKAAGITVKDVDLFMVADSYSYQEMIWTEALGICEKGHGGKLIDSGATQLGGATPVNPSGGVIAGVPILIQGLNRVAEAAYQLQGKAGKNQVHGAKIAVAQSNFGPAGQLQTVLVLQV